MKQAPFAELEVVRFLEHAITALHLDLTFEVKWRPESVPDLAITFTGPDVALLANDNGDLLRAIEHLAARVGGLELERRSPSAAAASNDDDRRMPQALHLAAAAPVPFKERRRHFKPSHSSSVKFDFGSPDDSSLPYPTNGTTSLNTVTTIACDCR